MTFRSEPGTPRRRMTALLLTAVLAGCAGHAPAPAAEAGAPAVGPASGTLIVAGGGRLGPEITGRFVELAGGADARIVIIPTAGERDTFRCSR